MKSVYIVERRDMDAKALADCARAQGVHVLGATPATLQVAVMATMRAWIDHKYHLCVRLDHGRANGHARYEHPTCHTLRASSIKV